MKKQVRIKAVSANIKGFAPMDQEKVMRCLEQIEHRRPDMVGAQEMWLRRYKTGLRQVLDGYRHFTPWFSSFRGMSETISVRYGWKPLGRKRVRQLHPDVRGEVDERQVLLWPFAKDGVRVLFMNLHMLPDRVQGDDGPFYDRGIATTLSIIRNWRSRGFNIILTGDFNEGGHPLGDQINGVRLAYASHEPDHIIAIPAPGFRAICETMEHLANPSDHDALVATMIFEEI